VGIQLPNSTPDRILAMDLSMNFPAYAIIDIVKGKALVKEVRYTDNKKNGRSKLSHAVRLDAIAKDIVQIVKDYPDIDYVVREKGFTRYNSTQVIFRVVGICDLMVYRELNVENIEEIPPTTIKRILAGYGKATKDEVAEGVREHLVPLQKDMSFYTDDCSDAIGVGITCMILNGWFK
jgi:crossover junction endodeoxyribonuclease RuvC